MKHEFTPGDLVKFKTKYDGHRTHVPTLYRVRETKTEDVYLTNRFLIDKDEVYITYPVKLSEIDIAIPAMFISCKENGFVFLVYRDYVCCTKIENIVKYE